MNKSKDQNACFKFSKGVLINHGYKHKIFFL